MRREISGYIRIIEPDDPLETMRRIVLVNNTGVVVHEFNPAKPITAILEGEDARNEGVVGDKGPSGGTDGSEDSASGGGSGSE